MLKLQLALFTLIVTLSGLQGAPVPKGAKKPPIHAGEWVQTWNSTDFQTTLNEDGTYRASTGSLTYVGTWCYDDRENRLSVQEWMEGSTAPHVLSWYVDFDKDLSGGTVGNVTAKVKFGKSK